MENDDRNKNYRQKYKNYYGINFDNNFVVHHLDGNRENNNINNLLLLPKRLHNSYHFHKDIITSIPIPTQICGNSLHNQIYYLNALNKFLNIIEQCNEWYDFKMYLEGEFPYIPTNINIDNIVFNYNIKNKESK